MNDEALELLSRLVSVNEEMLSTLEGIKDELSTLNDELNWTKEHSHSKMQLNKLEEIESRLFNIELNTSE